MNKHNQNINKNKKGKKIIFIIVKVFISLVCVALIGFGTLCLYAANFIFNDINTNTITKDKEELGITSGTVTVDHITNIALFGVDTRIASSFTGRSDVIMILTIDEIHNKLKMSSVLRDSRVFMGDDYNYTRTDYDKITHAYNQGPEFAIKVLNDNFGLDIQDYITVNFAHMAEIVDYFGGVDIDITSDEAYFINVHLLSGENVSTKGGVTNLNGQQAVSFARNRSIGGDEGRAERQRKVLEALIDKFLQKDVSEYPNMISELSSMVELSLDVTEILGFTPFVMEGFEIESTQVPNYEIAEDAVETGTFENGGWMWKFDIEATAKRLREFIYEGSDSELIRYD